MVLAPSAMTGESSFATILILLLVVTLHSLTSLFSVLFSDAQETREFASWGKDDDALLLTVIPLLPLSSDTAHYVRTQYILDFL